MVESHNNNKNDKGDDDSENELYETISDETEVSTCYMEF